MGDDKVCREGSRSNAALGYHKKGRRTIATTSRVRAASMEKGCGGRKDAAEVVIHMRGIGGGD